MPANFNTALDDILGMFKTVWDATYSSIAVVYPNMGGNPIEDTSSEWVRITTTRMGEGEHAGIGDGTGRYSKRGMIIFQVFTVKGLGISRANLLSQAIVDCFEGETSTNGVTTSRTEVRHIGSDGGWHQTNVNVFFDFDEYK
jgi:hypothetical protein